MRMALDSPALPGVADVDIVTASGEIHTGCSAQGDVVVPGHIEFERIRSVGPVVATLVVQERKKAGSRVVAAP